MSLSSQQKMRRRKINKVGTLIWFVLDKNAKAQLITALVLVLINSFLDFIGLASIIPAVLALKDSTTITTIAPLHNIYRTLGFLSTQSFVFCLLLFVFILFVIKSIISVLIIKRNTLVISDISKRLSRQVVSIIFSKSLTYLKDQNTSNLYRQINSYPTLFGTQILLNFLNLISEGVVIFLILGSILFYNYQIFLIVTGLILPIIYFFNRFYRKKIKSLSFNGNRAGIDLVKTFQNMVNGFVDIKMTNTEAFYADSLMTYTSRVNRVSAIGTVMSLLPAKVLELNAIFVLVVIYSTSFFLPVTGEQIFTVISFFIVAAYRIMPSSNKIMQATLTIRSNSFALIFLYKLLKQNEETMGKEKTAAFHREISFHSVGLQYVKNGKCVLNDFNLTLLKGEMIGVIGESGAGKSSFINLLLGFTEPTQGVIKVDDTILTHDLFKSWRSRIGYVKQDTFLFDGTIAENIAIGISADKIDREKVLQCLKGVKLFSLIDEHKDGIDAQVGEWGGKVSGGQKQRIGIARAIYKDPDIIIFDEATSALDITTEAEIINLIKELKDRSRSVIIVAHRYTNLIHCDRIVKMENGKISQHYDGYHDLLKTMKL